MAVKTITTFAINRSPVELYWDFVSLVALFASGRNLSRHLFVFWHVGKCDEKCTVSI